MKRNKAYGLMLILCGTTLLLVEKDATALIFCCTIGIPLFFSKKNWIE